MDRARPNYDKHAIILTSQNTSCSEARDSNGAPCFVARLYLMPKQGWLHKWVILTKAMLIWSKRASGMTYPNDMPVVHIVLDSVDILEIWDRRDCVHLDCWVRWRLLLGVCPFYNKYTRSTGRDAS